MTSTPRPPYQQTADPGPLQSLGRELLISLAMLMRSVKRYDPTNAVFDRPLAAVSAMLNALIAGEGKAELAVVEGSFYVNDQLVRTDPVCRDLLKTISREFAAHKIGGFSANAPPPLDDLRSFIWIFGRDPNPDPNSPSLPERPLQSLSIGRRAQSRERLDRESEGAEEQSNSGLTLYARTVFFVHHQIRALLAGKHLALAKAAVLAQDLVRAFPEHRLTLLHGLCYPEGDELFAYHLVNSAVLAVAFADGLELSKVQAKELALMALASELGLCRLPCSERLVAFPERLPAAQAAARRAACCDLAMAALAESTTGRAQQLRAVGAALVDVPFHRATPNAQDRTALPSNDDLPYYARLVSLCSYFDRLIAGTFEQPPLPPKAALMTMAQSAYWRFDPELLYAFRRVMAAYFVPSSLALARWLIE